MSLQELKSEVEELTPDERFELAAYLRHIQEKEDPAYHQKLRQTEARLSTGQGVSLDELRKLVRVMDDQGL